MSNADLLRRRQKAMPRVPFHIAPIFAVRAEGAKLWDADGNEYIDFCGGIGGTFGGNPLAGAAANAVMCVAYSRTA